MSNEKMFLISGVLSDRTEIRYASNVSELIRNKFEEDNQGEVFDKGKETETFFALWEVFLVEKKITLREKGLQLVSVDTVG